MNFDHSNDYSYLDRIRINGGADKCRDTFSALLRKDVRRAVTLLNDRRLMFPCLYILHDQILRSRIQRYLSPRNMTAIRIINQTGGPDASGANDLSSRQDTAYSVLRWILETGSVQEISKSHYEEILDVTVSVLINTYKDIDILPLVVDLIFKRNRSGRYIHDLVWALFRFHDPRVLEPLIERMRSTDPKDTELAAELLNFDEADIRADKDDQEGRISDYLHWLEENQPYLYFTEESFQYTSKPVFCAVDLERKYLQKGASPYDRQPISPSDDEDERMADFKKLSTKEQKVLSEYSQKMHSESVPAWKEWQRRSIEDQVRTAKAGSEGDE